MREKYIEQKLIKAVKAIGGIALKFISPGYNGVPDRLILLPGGIVHLLKSKRVEQNLDLCRSGDMKCFGN